MGDLFKIVFFSQKLLIDIVTYKVTTLDLKGQINVTISENTI